MSTRMCLFAMIVVGGPCLVASGQSTAAAGLGVAKTDANFCPLPVAGDLTPNDSITYTARGVSRVPLAAAQASVLRVYVPRTIRVQASTLRLDMICVVRCGDENLMARASAVPLGRSPVAPEEMSFDRATLLACLAAEGISAACVEFSGSDKVTVCRDEKIIDSTRLVASAQGLLQKAHPGSAGATYQLMDSAEDLHLLGPAPGAVLRPRLLGPPQQGVVKIEVAVIVDGHEQGAATLAFKVVFLHRVVVALRDIPSGATLTSDNVRLDTVSLDQPCIDEWVVPPLGMTAAAAIPAGAEIHASKLHRVEMPLIVRRNQSVIMKIQTPSFTLSTVGLCLQDGHSGDLIKVQNVDSQRVVTVAVQSDGTVTPVFEEKQ